MSDKPMSAREVARQMMTRGLNLSEEWIAERLEAYASEQVAKAREEQREQDARTFEDEYSNHDDPLIGVIRGLAAIRAKRAGAWGN